MDRYRLIASIVVLFIYLLAMYPWQTIVVTVIIAVAYLIISNIGTGNHDGITVYNSRKRRRQDALNQAKLYISPYRDIWRNLKLSNKFCSLRLQSNGHTIVGVESGEPYRTFRVVRSRVHSESDLWDMFCNVFDHNTNFDNLVELCRIFQADIRIEGSNYKLSQGVNYSVTTHSSEHSATVHAGDPAPAKPKAKKEKLDVNNASEVELTALPGISIVLAKKIIKKREEIGGFKSVNDFLVFTKLKSHMQTQLEELVCVKKMKGSVNIKRYEERKLDL